MSTLLDPNERPIPKTNGHNQDREAKADVRTLPTGTLIYNLIRFTSDEIGLENMIKQFEHAKEQQKMIEDPPALAKMREVYEQITHHRYIAARELNERFADLDKERLAKFGVEIITPDTVTTAEAPQEDKTS